MPPKASSANGGFVLPDDLDAAALKRLEKLVQEKLKQGGGGGGGGGTIKTKAAAKKKGDADKSRTRTKKKVKAPIAADAGDKKAADEAAKLAKEQAKALRELKEQERKEKAAKREAERVARELARTMPNQLVTFVDVTERKENSARVEMVAWPEITLQLDGLTLDENRKPVGCAMCVELYSQCCEWYQLHPDKVTLQAGDATIGAGEFTSAEDGMVTDPRAHEHEMWIGDRHIHLPKLTDFVARKKPPTDAAASAGEDAPVAATEENPEDEEDPSDAGGDVEAASAPAEVEASSDDGGPRRTGRKRAAEQPSSALESDQTDDAAAATAAAKRTKLDLVPAGHIARWMRKWVAYIRTKVYVERTGGRISAPQAGTASPHPFQEHLAAEFARVDFETVQAEDNAHMWQCWQAGCGKTLGPVFAMRAHPNPPQEVLFVTIKSAVHQTLSEIVKVPQLKGRTHWEIMGYDQFRDRLAGDRNYARGKVVVVDEVHTYRNLQQPMMVEMQAILEQPLYRFYLTGTPLQNQPTDVFYMMILERLAPLHVPAAGQKTLKQVHDQTVARRRKRACTSEDEKFDPRYYSLKNIQTLNAPEFKVPRTRKELRHFADAFVRSRSMFWYQPPQAAAIPTECVDYRVPMDLRQEVMWVMTSSNEPSIGGLRLGTATVNSFRSQSKKIENVLTDRSDAIVCSPKFEKMCQVIQECAAVPDRAMLPLVVYSSCKERGVYAVRDFVVRQPWARKLRVALIEGKTRGPEREEIRQQFNRGEVDLLFLSPVGKSSLDLLDCAGILFVEVPDSFGAQEQAAARILRSGAVQKRPGMVVKIFRFISTHNRSAPTDKALEQAWETLVDYARTSKQELQETYCVDLWPDLQEKLEEAGWETADEHRAVYNLAKNADLQPLLACMRGSTIDHQGHSKAYISELEQVLAKA